jgi:hypothetical protein
LNPPLRSALRSTLLLVLVPAIALLVPASAMAIQLRWSTGATDLTVTEDARAVLLVQANSAEARLPPTWRLLWTADSSGIQFAALDSATACLTDTARVFEVDPPSTPADSAANEITTRLCSAGSEMASSAYFLVDIIGGSQGKLKVVALDPADSTNVIESNDVTYNGGVDGDYSPTILSAAQTRTSTTVSVTAIGSGLSTVRESRIVAPDSSWVVALTPVQQTSTSLTARAEVPASLPPALLEVSGGPGRVASGPLSGDEIEAPTGDYSYGYFRDPSGISRPKDFSFFYDNLGHFHLFYILSYISVQADTNERRLGHVWGTSLRDDWSSPDIGSFGPDHSHTWDARNVWAPSLIQMGPTYYLFYAGRSMGGDQAIGVATTSNINTASIQWARPESPIVDRSYSEFQWIDQGGTAECRDPFVMVSPFHPDKFVMLYATKLGVTGKATIGVAWQWADSLTLRWHSLGHLGITTVSAAELSDKAESPHAFFHVNNASGDTSYYMCATGQGTGPTSYTTNDRFLRNRQSSWDLSDSLGPSHWSKISSLYEELGWGALGPLVFEGINASEYCRMYNHEYIAGVNATIDSVKTYAIWITMVRWLNGGAGPDSMVLQNPVTSVGGGAAAPGCADASGLRLAGRNVGRPPLKLQMTVAQRVAVDVAVYDVSGRRVKRLAAGVRDAGRQWLTWDGQDDRGRGVGPGVYFGRMTWRSGRSVVRLVVLR